MLAVAAWALLDGWRRLAACPMHALRIAAALTALVLAAASPCGAHGLQSNPAARGYHRAAGVVRQAAMPRIVVHGPTDAPPAAHRPSMPPTPVLVRDGGSTRRSSFGSQAALGTSATPRRAIAGPAGVLRARPTAPVAAVFHQANAPPVRVSSVTGRSA